MFTLSEAQVLSQCAKRNDWSMTREIRYRVISTLALMPKLNAEEFRAIYSVRSSINILGTNINLLIRKNQVIGDHNIDVCKELIGLISELKNKIIHLEKCSYSHFKLKSLECKKTESY